MSPKEVLDSTTPEVRRVIDQILKIEKASKHIQFLSQNKPAESRIVDEILRVICQEIK